MLPAATVLNINVPAVAAERIQGVKLAPLGRHGGFRVIYPDRPGHALRLSTIEVDRDAHAELEADTGWFARNYITVSVLRPDWNALPADSAQFALSLGDLKTLLPAP